MKEFRFLSFTVEVAASATSGGNIPHIDASGMKLTVTFKGLTKTQVNAPANVQIKIANFNMAAVAEFTYNTAEGAVLVIPNPIHGGITYSIYNPTGTPVVVTFMGCNS